MNKCTDNPNFPQLNTLRVLYSINGTTGWHTTYASADKYMKVSTDGGKTFSSAMKFIGDDGASASASTIVKKIEDGGGVVQIIGGTAPTALFNPFIILPAMIDDYSIIEIEVLLEIAAGVLGYALVVQGSPIENSINHYDPTAFVSTTWIRHIFRYGINGGTKAAARIVKSGQAIILNSAGETCKTFMFGGTPYVTGSATVDFTGNNTIQPIITSGGGGNIIAYYTAYKIYS